MLIAQTLTHYRSIPISRPCDLRYQQWGFSLVRLYREDFVGRIRVAAGYDPRFLLCAENPRPTAPAKPAAPVDNPISLAFCRSLVGLPALPAPKIAGLLPTGDVSVEELLEAVAEIRRAVKSDAVTDLQEAVEFAIAHPENEAAQVLPSGFILLSDEVQVRIVHPDYKLACIAAVRLSDEQDYRIVARRGEITALLASVKAARTVIPR